MEVDDGDGVLDYTPPLKRKRADDDDPRPSSRRKSLARTIADLRKANETLVDRITEAEGAIDVILNDVVEDSEGEDLSRVTRLKEIVQDYQTFSESAKTAAEVTESNSRVVVALTAEAERALADWDEVYQEFEGVRKEAAEIDNRANEVRHRFWFSGSMS
jgi:predicted  nucleic acid-binding Zn-ribbon protein